MGCSETPRKEMLSTDNFHKTLKFFIILWFMLFPVQGALYQASIYLIPILIYFKGNERKLFKQVFFANWQVVSLLVIPIFFSLILNLLFGLGERYESLKEIPIDPFFRMFWRVGFFSLSAYVALKILNVETLFIIKLIFICAITHAFVSLGVDYEKVIKFVISDANFRLYGTVDSPNELGILMSIGIYSGVSLIAIDKEKSYFQVFIYFLLIALLVLCLILTHSRASWLAFVISMLGFLVSLSFSKNIKTVLSVSLGFFFLGLVFYFGLELDLLHNRTLRMFDDPNRLAIWKYFIKVFGDSWLFGVYDLTSYSYTHTNGYVYKNPHSVFLDVAVRAGLIGIISFLVFLAIVLYSFINSKYFCVLIAIFLSVIVGTSFSFSIYTKEFAQSLYVILLILFLINGDSIKKQR